MTTAALGFDAFESFQSSPYLLEQKDRLVASEVARYYQIAKRIIIENREFLDVVTEALIDHKTVTFREMQSIRERYVAEMG